MNIRQLSILSVLLLLFSANFLYAANVNPVPTLTNVNIEAGVSYDNSTERYSYNYKISNPGGNTGEIITIRIGIKRSPIGNKFSGSYLTIPFGKSTKTFDEILNSRIDPVRMVPVGITVPDGWWGSIGATGFSAFNAGLPTGSGMTGLLPGESLAGFGLVSEGFPTIREVTFVPHWIYVSDSLDGISNEESAEARDLADNIQYNTFTVGPSALYAGSRQHWIQFGGDITRTISFGWILDNNLATTMQTQFASARKALDAGDGTLAKSNLQVLVDSLDQATSSQIIPQALNLIRLNALLLIQRTPDTPIPFEPLFSITPASSSNNIGQEYTITARVVNLADNNSPVDGYYVALIIADGPHRGRSWSGVTDDNGNFIVRYTGTKVGTDHIAWIEEYDHFKNIAPKPIMLASAGTTAGLLIGLRNIPLALAQAEVTWTGGPDLVVPLFIPPEIQSQGGKPIYISDIMENIGILEASASTTRYYLTSSLPFNINNARVIGERRVNPLAPGIRSELYTLKYDLPSDLGEGTYYMAACADAKNEIVELDENNNCSFNKLETSSSHIVPTFIQGNSPPVCSQAAPSTATLWPPNHKLHEIVINGVSDPDGDSVSIVVESISQDELVNGLGDGDTGPDGFGVGTSVAKIRAERSGLSDGRIYVIAFTAVDSSGGSCTGSVSVGVPHDQGEGATPINSGAKYDSTKDN